MVDAFSGKWTIIHENLYIYFIKLLSVWFVKDGTHVYYIMSLSIFANSG